jgi:hypothetical protein
MGITKMVIKAYADDQFSSEKGEFTAFVNPENIKITSSIDYFIAQGLGVPNVALRYHTSPPSILSFKLLFDDTGVIPDSQSNVPEQLDNLKKLIYDFQEDIHAPYYLRMIWGVIDFKGRLGSLETSYTMFHLDGRPLRAQADIVIIETVTAGASIKIKSSNQSNNNTQQSNAKASSSKNAQGGSSNTQEPGSKREDSGRPQKADSEEEAISKESPESKQQLKQETEDPDQASGSQPQSSEGGDGEESVEASSVHEVHEGEKLPGIANKNLGDPNQAKDLGRANNLDNLREVDTGKNLLVP